MSIPNIDPQYSPLPYRIVFSSGEDPLHPISELLTPGKYCKGWESAKHCIYPQVIILQFMGIVQLRTIQFLSHHTKIANRIKLSCYTPEKVYPLPKPDCLDDLNFRQIGHLSLGDNKKHEYTARELKSVALELPVFYLKIVFHGCYLNQYNKDNQIGILAINCFGNPTPDLTKKKSKPIPFEYDKITKERLDQLEEIKNKALEIDDFKKAAEIKELINTLKNYAQQLALLESKKAAVIQNEDYVAAKILNAEIMRIRDSIIMEEERVAPKLQTYTTAENIREEVRPIPQNENQILPLTQDLILKDPVVERVIAKAKTPERKISSEEDKRMYSKAYEQMIDSTEEGKKEKSKQSHEPKPKKVIEEVKKSEEIEGTFGKKLDLEENPEPLNKKVKKLADPYLPHFDLSLLEMAFSKIWTFREQAIKTLVKEVTTNKFSAILTKDRAQAFAALLGLMGYLVMDSVLPVALQAMDFVKLIANTLTDSVDHIKGYFGGELDSCLSALMEQVGNSNGKIRKKAYETFIELPKNPNIEIKTLISHILSSQNKKTQQSVKHVQGKLKIVHTLFQRYITKPKDPLIPTIIKIALAGVNHASNEVRTEAYDLLASIREIIGTKIDQYLTDLRQAQRDLLQAKFKSDKPITQEQVEEPKITVTTNIKHSGGKSKKKKPVIEEKESLEKECEYCGRHDPRFNENALDLHMYKACPMLYLCQNCKNVIEIINLNTHLLEECSAADNYEPCSICNEAILRDEIDQHLQEADCVACDPEKAIKCPLCHKEIQPATDETWKNHILNEKCPNNPRKVI